MPAPQAPIAALVSFRSTDTVAFWRWGDSGTAIGFAVASGEDGGVDFSSSGKDSASGVLTSTGVLDTLETLALLGIFTDVELGVLCHLPRTPSTALKKPVEPAVMVRVMASRVGASCWSSFRSLTPSDRRRPMSDTTVGFSLQGCLWSGRFRWVRGSKHKDDLPWFNDVEQHTIRRAFPYFISVCRFELGHPKGIEVLCGSSIHRWTAKNQLSIKHCRRKVNWRDPPVMTTPLPSPLATKSRYRTADKAAEIYSSN